MINLTQKTNCCGCSACVAACPTHCLTMRADEEGFLYPCRETPYCSECGLCKKVCPLLHRPAQKELVAVFGAKNSDERVRSESSSGGIFSLLAGRVLEQGGCVFGAALGENFTVRHIKVEDEGELARLRKSKYVQSVMGNCYQEVKKALFQGKKVLFSGTPCQVAGLKGFLQNPYDALFTVDMVCHGVPSPRVYRKYLDEMTAEAGESIVSVSFRDKGDGWRHSKPKFCTESRVFTASMRRDPFMRLFLNNVSIRPVCGDCAFNNKRSLADLTIADYWGVHKQFPDFDDDKGITLVIVNNARGLALFEQVAAKAAYIATTYEKGAQYNVAVSKSLGLQEQRQEFFADLDKHSLAYWANYILGEIG